MENTSMLEAALHQHSVQMLQRQLEVKFALSVDMVSDKLQRLALPQLEALFVELFKLKTVQQLNKWFQEQLEKRSAEAEYQFELELIQLGLLKTQPLKTTRTHFAPIYVTGQPLSEQIVMERC